MPAPSWMPAEYRYPTRKARLCNVFFFEALCKALEIKYLKWPFFAEQEGYRWVKNKIEKEATNT
jgi:hypothetical protein